MPNAIKNGQNVKVIAAGQHNAVIGSTWTVIAHNRLTDVLALTTKHGGVCHVPSNCVEFAS